ncbi:MAG: hypothetical protein RR481_05755, partial [Longicatena sp.]
ANYKKSFNETTKQIQKVPGSVRPLFGFVDVRSLVNGVVLLTLRYSALLGIVIIFSKTFKGEELRFKYHLFEVFSTPKETRKG